MSSPPDLPEGLTLQLEIAGKKLFADRKIEEWSVKPDKLAHAPNWFLPMYEMAQKRLRGGNPLQKNPVLWVGRIVQYNEIWTVGPDGKPMRRKGCVLGETQSSYGVLCVTTKLLEQRFTSRMDLPKKLSTPCGARCLSRGLPIRTVRREYRGVN